MANFWEIAAHSVGHLYLLYFVYFLLCLFVFYLFPILVLRASAITMPELVEINLVSDDDNSLTDRKEICRNIKYCDFSRYEMKL